MSQTNIAIIQLAQLGFAERIAYETQGNPEMAREVAQQTSLGALKQQRESVEKTEATAKSRAIKTDKDGSNKHQGGQEGQQKKQSNSSGETESAPDSPWSGNIVNFKV